MHQIDALDVSGVQYGVAVLDRRTGKENLGAFGTELAGHSRSDGAAGTKHNGALVVQDG